MITGEGESLKLCRVMFLNVWSGVLEQLKSFSVILKLIVQMKLPYGGVRVPALLSAQSCPPPL